MKPLHRYSLGAILLAIVAASSMGSAAQTEYYRWLDSRGNPINSDIPPPAGIDYEVISTKSTFSKAIAAQQGEAPQKSDSTVGDDIAPTASTETGNYKKDPELCEIARTNLGSLTNYEKVKTRDELGKERYLSPEEMEVGRQTATAQISVYCE